MIWCHNLNLEGHQSITTLVDLLRYRSGQQPSKIAFTFLKDGETESDNLTYQELDQKARAIAAQLQSLVAVGERALLLYPSGLEFIAAFFGCLYAGVVAVPAYPPRRNQNLSRLLAIVSDAQAKVTLTTTSELINIEGRLAQNPELAAMRWLATDNINSDQASNWQEAKVSSDTLAFLQYTSGSTGMPKGVMISHRNLLHNEEMIKRAFQHTEESIVVGWLPLFHDMGLIGNVLQPLYLGIPSILLSPVEFLQKPLRWLQAISHYKATTSGGPNFAYDFCVQKIPPSERASLDLSRWEVAFSGAEPVRAQTLERFATAFEPCGFRARAFYPCYGMAETTLFVSGGLKIAPPVVCQVEETALEQNGIVATIGQQQGTKEIVGCGEAWLDEKIVIVHPESLTLCPVGQVGEIWVSGANVAQGYWNRPSQTEQTFHAYLADTGEGPFLRTGDLGFLQDGELFVTGRLKDMIIIRGRNHYPQDIELTIEQSHPALRPSCGAAFSVEIAGQEKLVIAQEVERNYLRKLNANEVIGEIRRAVADQHDLQVYAVLLLKTASLPKTSSGKVQRSACRAGFLAGSLDVVADWSVNPRNLTKWHHLEAEVESLLQQMQTGKLQGALSESNNCDRQALIQPKSHSVEAIQAWLISKVSEQLEVAPDEVDIRQPFAYYGLSSLAAVSISGEAQEWLGLKLSPTLLYDYPTIEILAQHLAVEPAVCDLGTQSLAPLQRVDVGDQTETEAIAIIGLGCRFPGANNPQAFWQLLRDGVDAIKEVPPSRWDVSAFYDPTPGTPGKMNTRWGGFLKQVDQFDPQFFGISPREAEIMDPQQRLLLEVSWEALENAGQAPEQLAGSQTGVFIGISNNDYFRLQFNHRAGTDAYSVTGNALSIAANRLSYLLDLRGPSWAVDTACSSSLVAVHQACLSLRQGECQLALVSGVNLILTPQLTITFSQAQMMAADGHCKTFDASADGYVRGEGCGVAVLKRLCDAQRDGDNILAVIRGSAVNQDGRSNGLTAPNGLSQQAVIRQALENAGVAPAQISYVEAHGTGTSLGDPIEVNSLKEVLMAGRSPDQPCWIGSVKTNIGHLEAAAGIASLIKVVLSLQHREIPPHLYLKQLNPYISLEETTINIPTERQSWSSSSTRLTGVSSFGFGGTNCHVILEEAPVGSRGGQGESPSILPLSLTKPRPLHLLTISAKSEKALRKLAQRYEDFLESHPEASLADICFTANTGRSHFDQRLAVMAESTVQLRQHLSAFAAGQETAGLVSDQLTSRKRPKIAFLFTGQGSQYVNMGRQLYETQPTFRACLERCDELLRPYLQTPLLEVLYSANGTSTLLDQTAYTQPALFALEYALVELWKSWGIEPTVVMGHSVGEYVAACVAGVFSLEDGLKMIAERGRLMQALPEDCEMVVVFADEALSRAVIQPYAQEVSIATINGPKNTVISGKRQAVEAVIFALQAQGIKTKKLNVSHAFHSPLMEPMLLAFEQVAVDVAYSSPRIKLISNVTGKLATGEIATPEYWCRHVRQPVRFSTGMETLHQLGYEVFVEIGPKPILLGMGRECLPEGIGVWLPSLSQERKDWQRILQSLGELYVRGVPVDWSSFDRDYPRRRLQLPTYPFQRERYWADVPENGHQKAKNSFHKNPQTSIINLLNQGDTQELVQHLQKAGKLSEDELQLLPKLLEVLVKQNQQQLTAGSIKDLIYEIEWQSKPRQLTTTQEQSGFHEPGSWLIFADLGGVGQTLAKLLQERGHRCILVYPGEAYETKETGTWSIKPSSPADIKLLLQEALGTLDLPLQGVIHLWSLEAGLAWDLTIPSLEQAQALGVGSVLYLLQALVKHNKSASPQLWLVTRGAVPAGASLPAVAQAPLWGLGKVLALEHPELWGGMLDLSPEADCDMVNKGEQTLDEATKLLAEIGDSQGEDHLAFRDGHRYVARLVQKQLPESQGVMFQPDSTYLITGGLGALGLRIAEWMVEQGCRQLVLIGRRGVSSHVQETLSQLEQAGTKVLVVQADVSNEADMIRVFEAVKASMPPLRGVVHAAGVPGYEAIKDMELSTLESVLRPKVVGTWILHQLTQGIKLDFFVNFSSIASVWGSKGQAHYAAANHFLDVLAHYRQGLGLPALSVNWGPWASGGMASPEFQTWLTRMGVEALEPPQAIAALGYLLGAGCLQTTVANVDWSVFKGLYEARGKRSLLEQIEAHSRETSEQQSVQRSEILQRLETAAVGDRHSLVIDYIQALVAKVLGLRTTQLEMQQPLNTMGLDSLMAVELRNQVRTELGVDVPIVKFMEGFSVTSLATQVSEQLTNAQFSSSASLCTPPTPSQGEQKTAQEDISKRIHPENGRRFSRTAISDSNWIEGEI